MKINVGIIGFGRMGQFRYKALKKLNKFCKVVPISEEMKNININIKNCNVFNDHKKIKFNVDNSLNNEVKIFINSILKNKIIRSSNSKDALQIMTLVDKIYKQSIH